MSDIAPTLPANPDADPVIDPDDIGAQVEAVFAAQGVVRDEEPVVEPAADEAPPEAPATTDAPYVDAPLPPVEGGPSDLPPEQIAAEVLADPDATTEPPADPTANLIDLGNGLVVDREEAAQYVQFIQNLTPLQAAAIEQALAQPSTAASGSGTPGPVYTTPAPAISPYQQPQPGYYPPAPVGQPGAPIYPPQYPTQPGAMPQPYPQPVAQPYPAPVAPQPGYPQTAQPYPQGPIAPPDLSALADFAPGLSEFLTAQAQQTAALQQQLAANTAYQQEQLAMQARAQEEARNQAISAGRDRFAAEHPDLTDVDMHYLAQRVAASQSIAPLIRQHNGDVQAAMADALTTAMYSDPSYRDRVVQSAVQTHADTSAEIAARREAAASLSGSRGALGPVPQPNPANLPPQQRQAALISDIAAAVTGAGN